MAVRQDINVGLIAFVGLVGSILLLIAVWGTQGWFAYEVQLLNQKRFETDRNLDWLALRNEQYANIGDDVGNTTIFAVAEEPTMSYRFLSEKRDVAGIPIHEAMARLASQHGGSQFTADQMRAADREHATIVNEVYKDYMTPGLVTVERAAPSGAQTRPAGGGA